VTIEDDSSDWSAGTVRRVTAPQGYCVERVKDYVANPLLAVQRALLRMCTARGDLFAVLALPEHYREDAAIDHVGLLKAPGAPAIDVNVVIGGLSVTREVQPLGYGEQRTHSYGALYHPWLIESRSDRPLSYVRMPPDGAAAGLMAGRALQRGAWVAPANDLLHEVIALSPAIERARWLDLQVAQVNVVRQEARGFVVMSADTLSDDAELRPINVRRLLMLLRRLALREGATYVFEPNNDMFRRLVQRNFTFLLEGMYRRGAFAGPTPESSFQVVVSNTLNTRQQVEQGRFIVELRVAPSLPMTFLTVRLVQTYARTQVTE
jgi:phage tail sheath protein FI